MKNFPDFLKEYKTIKFKKGQVLVRPGDTFDKIIIEKKGFARVYRTNKTDQEVSWPILKPMWLYSWITVLNDNKSQYYTEAVTEIEAWSIPVDDFKKFLEQEDKESFYMAIINDLVELSAKTEKLILADAYNKVLILLTDLAKNFGKKVKEGILIDFNIPHRVWASITGLTRETITLQILKMQKEGLLENQKRKMLIKSPDLINN